MESFRTLVVLLFFCYGNLSFAETSPCFTNKRINLPPQILYYYITQNGLDRIFPLGNNDCPFPDSAVEIYNLENQQQVALFRPQKKIQTYFNEVAFTGKNIDPIIFNFFERLKKQDFDPIKFIFYFSNFINPKERIDFKKPIYFSVGKIENLKLEAINWNPYHTPKKHWAAETLDYKDFIQFYLRPDINFIHVDSHENYEIPISSNSTQYINPLNLYHTPLTQIILSLKVYNYPKESSTVVVSKTQNDWIGYNTITNLYSLGFRNIYWMRNSMSIWRNTLKEKEFDYYLSDFKQISSENLYEILQSPNNISILDISERSFYEQVQFTNSIHRTPAYASPAEAKNWAKMAFSPQLYASFIKGRTDIEGMYYIPDAKTLFRSPTNIILITNNHYEGSPAIRSIYRQLTYLGHSVSILSSDTGDYLSYLKKRNLNSPNTPKEKRSLFLKFEQTGP